MAVKIVCIAGPTASGKSARAVTLALKHGGEVISVDSRQVYRGLDIGTEKIAQEEMQGVPHHLIDIRDMREIYSAGDFVTDATRLITDISKRGKLPILVGGTHFYFDALLKGLPEGTPVDAAVRAELENLSTEELYAQVLERDPRRARDLDPKNRRRLIRALEIIHQRGTVPSRPVYKPPNETRLNLVGEVEWIVIDPLGPELRARIDARLKTAFERGLVREVQHVRDTVGDTRLNELGLEYRVVGEYVLGERTQDSLVPALSAKLWQFARRQKAWLRKLRNEHVISAVS